MVAMKPKICREEDHFIWDRHKNVPVETQVARQRYPSSLRGAVQVSGHRHDGNNEKDDGGRHASHKILKRRRNQDKAQVRPALTGLDPKRSP